LAVCELDDDILGDCVRIHENRDERGWEIDEAILQRLLQGNLGLDNITSRLLGRHDDED
jgi:hypothetical protein